jgi:hypothetical protein
MTDEATFVFAHRMAASWGHLPFMIRPPTEPYGKN